MKLAMIGSHNFGVTFRIRNPHQIYSKTIIKGDLPSKKLLIAEADAWASKKIGLGVKKNPFKLYNLKHSSFYYNLLKQKQ